jgi:uncharacterized membrane-anchored protein YhcB (DUF1043 family)
MRTAALHAREGTRADEHNFAETSSTGLGNSDSENTAVTQHMVDSSSNLDKKEKTDRRERDDHNATRREKNDHNAMRREKNDHNATRRDFSGEFAQRIRALEEELATVRKSLG